MRSDIKRKVQELNAALPQAPSIFVPGVSQSNGKYSPMVKGNRLAAKENLTPEAHQKRQAALMRGWQNRVRRRRGEKIMKHTAKKKASVSKRLRKHEKAVMDYRQMQDAVRRLAPDGVKALEEILMSTTSRPADKIAATQVIFDRSYGKANQPNTNVNIDAHGKNTEISGKELEERIRHTLKQIEELTGGAGGGPERTVEKDAGKDRPADIRKRDGDPGSSTLH